MIAWLPGTACTNFLVGKKASVDGGVYITYNADSYGMYGRLIYLPHAKHAAGTMHKIYDGDSNKYLGEIPEAAETYTVNGYINEFQVAIMETTFGGREELVDPEGKIDYTSLMRLALQRSRTAREAIQVMTTLVAEHGYASGGESFSVADKNEVWVMEMVGRGKGEKGALWAAVRIPDDCVAAHANQSRIHRLNIYPKKDVITSPDLIKWAKAHGYYKGKDADFDFAETFSPTDFGSQRYCDARAWSFFNRFVEGMDRYVDYVDGFHVGTSEVMPLYFKPKRLLSRQDLMDAMRDHYEGTPFDVTCDAGMGPGEMPYRPTPLSFEVDGKKYFNERPISTQQTADTYIAQLRSDLPDVVGGVLWYGNDDPNMISYVPIYCNNYEVPACFDDPQADDATFSWGSAFWVCNWVANMVYPRYNQLFPALQKERDRLDKLFSDQQPEIEQRALALLQTDEAQARTFLCEYSKKCGAQMLADWKKLGEYIIVKFNDMTIKPETNGRFDRTEHGLIVSPQRPGYAESYRRKIVEQTGDRYLIPSENK